MFYSRKSYIPIIICILLFLINPGNAQELEELNYIIIDSFPTPAASPQDLAWDGEYLWLADDSTDIIYKINTLDGSVSFFFNSPGPEPKGLAFDGTYLWNLDDSLKKIYKLNYDNGLIIDSLNLPDEYNGMPVIEYPFAGLGWDGEYFWTSFFAGWSSSTIRIEPENGSVDTFFYGYSQDIAFDGTSLWTVLQNGSYKGFVDKREIPYGNWIAYFRTPGYYPTGLAYDGAYLWLVDSGADTLYKIEVLPTSIDYSNYNDIPSFFKLYQNYPNPFNPSTIIKYNLPKPSKVNVTIYNSIGQKIKDFKINIQNSGIHELTWDGKNNGELKVPSGIYFIHFTAHPIKGENEIFSKSIKALLMR